MRRLASVVAAAACVWIALAAAGMPPAARVPPLVFVSRTALPPDTGSYGVERSAPAATHVAARRVSDVHVPGLGPRDRTRAAGGRLLVRRPGGRIEPLVRDGTFFDVSDPGVSWDGRRVAFAAVRAPGDPWRLWIVNADGTGLIQLTTDDRRIDLAPLGAAAARFARYDDIDPAWLPDGRVCFASTRFPQIAQEGDGLVTNLFIVRPGGGVPERLTSERNGAEEPSIAPDGRIVYARWWFNRYLASDVEPAGVTTRPERAVPAEPVDLWQAVAITVDGDGLRLAGGHPRVRAETMAHQPLLLGDGTLIGVRAERTSLVPSGGALSVERFPGGIAAPVRIAGGGPASACAPAALPDGRILFSYDPSGGGDFGLWVADRNGRRLARVLDLPGTFELDAAPLVARRAPPFSPGALPPPTNALPALQRSDLGAEGATFRFDCLNVFANAPVDVPIPDAPPLQHGLRIRFYATLARPSQAGGDTVVLVRESHVDVNGGVHEDNMPADTPMFEQLIDAHGRVVRSASGPAHVAGANTGRFGTGTKCVGCHLGHSTILVPSNSARASRFNASPAARVEASSVAERTAGAQAVVDRRARGLAEEVAWIAAGRDSQWIRLCWETPIEVDSVVIYALQPNPSRGTDLQVRSADVVLLFKGREVGRRTVGSTLSPRGTRVACGGIRVDALEIRPMRLVGNVRRRPVAAIGEVETIARIAAD